MKLPSISWREPLPMLTGLLASLVAVGLSLAFGPGRAPTLTEDGQIILDCCIRKGADADSSSALMQQEVASAIVGAGGKITGFRAPRASQKNGVRRMKLNVSFVGDEKAVFAAIKAIENSRRPIAISDAVLKAGADQQPVTAQLQLVQWAFLSEGAR